MAVAYIALGSNLGDRQDYLDRALEALQERPDITVNQVSSYRETAPVGGPPGQGPYLNATAELQTELKPHDLLQALLEVELLLGRVRTEPNGPRTIDLDLLLYDDRVEDEPGLTLPHARMHERRFVLGPLSEIAPDIIHPRLHTTIRELLDLLPPETPSPGSPVAIGPRTDIPPSVASVSENVRSPSGRELTGLRALVTGSTSGIGRAIALELASAGADVIVHGRRSDAAEQVAAEVRQQQVRGGVVLADLHDPDACAELVRRAWAEWGGLDIWVNNAGADTLTGTAANWTFERKLDELLAVDVRATMRLARAVGERMKAVSGGAIVNVGWDQAETGMEGDSGQLFAATKAAVMAFSKSLALTLAPTVRVNCVAPGWIRTAWGEGASGTWQDRVRRETPLRRWGTPEDVARVVRWLVSPAAAFLTGQVVRVNGGAVR
jgi:2-amino-4-hydroxy-6-hydroxymethyldihydropteridine diphosphokinase